MQYSYKNQVLFGKIRLHGYQKSFQMLTNTVFGGFFCLRSLEMGRGEKDGGGEKVKKTERVCGRGSDRLIGYIVKRYTGGETEWICSIED